MAAVSAYIFVWVQPGKNEEVVAALRKVPGVRQASVCWGQPDIIAFVEVSDDRALADTVLAKIQGLAAIRSTETHIVAPV